MEYKSADIVTAIGIIKSNDFDSYKKFCKYIGAIDSDGKCGKFSSGTLAACAYGENRISMFSQKGRSLDETASVLVHEACHFRQGYVGAREIWRNNPAFSQELESECYQEAGVFLTKIKK